MREYFVRDKCTRRCYAADSINEYILNEIILKSIREWIEWAERREVRLRRWMGLLPAAILAACVSSLPTVDTAGWLASASAVDGRWFWFAMVTNRKTTASSKHKNTTTRTNDDGGGWWGWHEETHWRTHYTQISNNNFIHHLLHVCLLCGNCWWWCDTTHTILELKFNCFLTRLVEWRWEWVGEVVERKREHAIREAFRKQISSRIMNAKRQLRLDLDTLNGDASIMFTQILRSCLYYTRRIAHRFCFCPLILFCCF